MTVQTRPDNRLLQVRNESAVLDALARYGFLSAAELQALCWRSSASPRQAQRTLANLRKARLVLQQYEPGGCPMYCITSAGAARIHAITGQEDAHPTTLALKSCFRHVDHRQVANAVCIWWETDERTNNAGVNTEYQIATGRAIIGKLDALFGDFQGKIPDALLLAEPQTDANGRQFDPVVWVEAECGRKKKPAMEHMAKVMCRLVAGYGRNNFDLGVGSYEVVAVMVACPDSSHEERVAKALLMELSGSGGWMRAFERILIWRPAGESAAHTIALRAWLKKNPEVIVERPGPWTIMKSW